MINFNSFLDPSFNEVFEFLLFQVVVLNEQEVYFSSLDNFRFQMGLTVGEKLESWDAITNFIRIKFDAFIKHARETVQEDYFNYQVYLLLYFHTMAKQVFNNVDFCEFNRNQINKGSIQALDRYVGKQ